MPTILGAALLLAAALPGAVSAKGLGVRGATWPVAEPDLLEQIEARLREMERSGELARLEQEARASASRKLEEPDPAPGIAPATRERSRLWDPAITVARDIRTPDGTLIAAAGTRVNPLEPITGAFYKASGWIHVGTTQGHGRYDRHTRRDQPNKDVWIRPLRKDWRRTLNR